MTRSGRPSVRGARVWIGDVDGDVCRATAAELGVAGVALDVTDAAGWRGCLAGKFAASEAGR